MGNTNGIFKAGSGYKVLVVMLIIISLMLAIAPAQVINAATINKVAGTNNYYYVSDVGWHTGLAIVTYADANGNQKSGVVNSSGKFVLDTNYQELRDGYEAGLYAFKQNEKWGVIDKAGKVLVKAIYDDIKLIDNNCIVVKNSKEKWGIITTKGKTKVGFIYDNIGYFSYNNSDKISYAIVTNYTASGERQGLINVNGKEVIKPQYQQLEGNIWKGIMIAQDTSGRWGAINLQGRTTIKFNYDYLGYSYSNDSYIAKLKDWYGAIDRSGKTILDFKYEMLSEGMDKQYTYAVSDRWGVIDNKGKVLIKPQYTYIYDVYKYYIINDESVEKFGILNKDGKVILKPTYHELLNFRAKTQKDEDKGTDFYALGLTYGQDGIQNFGLVEMETGKEAIKSEYSSLTVPTNGYSFGVKDGSLYIIKI